ncbi:MAG: RsmD family RNA methyltransferase [Gemmataceae bacterium]|nr:RsmD family RNA methyltransferase [Gemmataceae bacterium]
MRIQLRIVAGSLRGRKLHCQVHEGLRPTPQMVREALFSILGNAVPERTFIDLFAGTGAIGLEALSRDASLVLFVERDVRLAGEIDSHLHEFGVAERARLVRTDAYRWAERWQAPAEPVNIFVSPPFPDFEKRPEAMVSLLGTLQAKTALGSVIVLQGERGIFLDQLPDLEQWDVRYYGRNMLLIWVKESPAPPAPGPEPE